MVWSFVGKSGEVRGRGSVSKRMRDKFFIVLWGDRKCIIILSGDLSKELLVNLA